MEYSSGSFVSSLVPESFGAIVPNGSFQSDGGNVMQLYYNDRTGECTLALMIQGQRPFPAFSFKPRVQNFDIERFKENFNPRGVAKDALISLRDNGIITDLIDKRQIVGEIGAPVQNGAFNSATGKPMQLYYNDRTGECTLALMQQSGIPLPTFNFKINNPVLNVEVLKMTFSVCAFNNVGEAQNVLKGLEAARAIKDLKDQRFCLTSQQAAELQQSGRY